jgi:hypothetical protein
VIADVDPVGPCHALGGAAHRCDGAVVVVDVRYLASGNVERFRWCKAARVEAEERALAAKEVVNVCPKDCAGCEALGRTSGARFGLEGSGWTPETARLYLRQTRGEVRGFCDAFARGFDAALEEWAAPEVVTS